MPMTPHPTRTSDVLQWELNQNYCREEVTLRTGTTNLTIGSVLGRNNSDGEYTDYNDSITGGINVAAAILADNYADPGSDFKVVVWKRGPVILNRSELKFLPSQTSTQQNNGISDLEDLGFVFRDSI